MAPDPHIALLSRVVDHFLAGGSTDTSLRALAAEIGTSHRMLLYHFLAAGLIDLVQVTLFPVITGRTGINPVFAGAADVDLELVDRRTLDGRTVELSYRPRLH